MATSVHTSISVLDAYAAKDTFLHRVHPAAHVAVTFCYIIVVTSYGKYAVSGILPLLFAPLLACRAGEIPLGAIFKRTLPALPLVIGLGIFNPLLDHQTTAFINGLTVSAGWLSFVSLALRCMLCVTASLLLVSMAGFEGVSETMAMFRFPRVFVAIFVLTFRYIQILAEEVGRILLAYRLRAPGKKYPVVKEWGALAGQWLLRTLKRGDRLYQAMLCRGYRGYLPLTKKHRFTCKDSFYILICCAFFITARVVNIPQWIGNAVLRFI